MAGLLQFRAVAFIGSTDLYARLYDCAGQIYNVDGAAMEAIVEGNVAEYDIALAETGATGFFSAAIPSVPTGLYWFEVCEQAGVNPAWTDPVVGQSGWFSWDGSTEIGLSDLATPADVVCALAVSETDLEEAMAGMLTITLWHSWEQIIESETTEDLSTATKLWLGIKRDWKEETDAWALVLIEETAGLQVLAQEAYTGAPANGSLTVSGGVGAWQIVARLEKEVTGELEAWGNQEARAELKAIVGDDTVDVWSGRCRFAFETVRGVV